MPLTIAQDFTTFSAHRMELSERDINACLDRLTEEQMLYRGGDNENSILNLLMHLEGNLRQWFLHGIDNQPDIRTRDAEFTLSPTRPIAEVRASVAATLAECRKVVAAVPESRLLEEINPQPGGTWGTVTVLEAIIQVVGHVQYHTGQIILLTKQFTHADLNLSMPRKR